ncbi:MAG: Tol-Pal system protein TolB, partial [Luminiphilus sp.]
MRQLLLIILLTAVGLTSTPTFAQLQIEITRGVDNPTPIAVVPFGWLGSGAPPEDIARIVDSDLARSGQFAPVSRRDMLSYPTRGSDLYFRDWRAIDSEYVLIGPTAEARMLAHKIADKVYEKLTGIPGAFATRLLYVSVTRNPNGKDFYRLTLADSDGARPIVLLESREP